MPDYLLRSPSPAWRPPSFVHTLLNRLHATWRALSSSEREQYLSQAGSHAELEQRLRQWDDYCVHRTRSRSIW